MNKVVAQSAGAIALVVALLWGVPYYIRAQVADQVTAINDAAPKSPDITALEAKYQVIETRLDAIDSSLLRIDMTVGVFSSSFIAYLERQAE